MKLIEKNLEKIQSFFMDSRYYPLSTHNTSSLNSLRSIHEILLHAKEHRLIPQTTTLQHFSKFLVDNTILHQITLEIDKKVYTRYSINSELDLFYFIKSIHERGFFSMSTALNMQGIIEYRPELIFFSNELSKKEDNKEKLTQDKIDSAFKKKYRYTQKITAVSNTKFTLIQLEPKHTNNYGVITTDQGFYVSSINRALVEMVVNIQYFNDFQTLVNIFKPIKERLNIKDIVTIIEKFDFIYPYYNSIGFFLEELGFTKDELSVIHQKISDLIFYTEKEKAHYQFNEYWKVYF